jgi:hypothetical protein
MASRFKSAGVAALSSLALILFLNVREARSAGDTPDGSPDSDWHEDGQVLELPQVCVTDGAMVSCDATAHDGDSTNADAAANDNASADDDNDQSGSVSSARTETSSENPGWNTTLDDDDTLSSPPPVIIVIGGFAPPPGASPVIMRMYPPPAWYPNPYTVQPPLGPGGPFMPPPWGNPAAVTIMRRGAAFPLH